MQEVKKDLPQVDKRHLAAWLRKMADRLEREADNPAFIAFAEGVVTDNPKLTDVSTYEDFLNNNTGKSVLTVSGPIVQTLTVRIEKH